MEIAKRLLMQERSDIEAQISMVTEQINSVARQLRRLEGERETMEKVSRQITEELSKLRTSKKSII